MTILYSDINAKYRIGTSELLLNIRAIENSIDSILSTNVGERFFLPMFGSNLLAHIHEPINEITADNIKDALITAIERWEPRVEVIFSRSYVIPFHDRNLYEVLISYFISGLGVESTLRRDLFVR